MTNKSNSIKIPPRNTSSPAKLEVSKAEVFRVALYIRVSTERQANEGDSLEDQENDLKKYCDFRNFSIHNIYIERGKSGGNTNRPEYQKLIKDIKQRKINAVVVKKLDHLSRSLLDFENLMNLMNENEVEFISIKENFDTTTAMGKAMLRVALVFAQLEREQTSERICDVMGYRASQGIYNGGVRPLGYSVINKELVPYKKEKVIVEHLFQTFLETRSTVAAAKALNEAGFTDQNNKPFEKRQVVWILKNPLYTGIIRWNGNYYEGIHQPIIAPQTFEKVQAIFKLKTFTKTKGAIHALLIKRLYCSHCGSPMAPTFGLNKKKVKYFYYRCTGSKDKDKTCLQPYFSFIKLEARITEILLSLSEEKSFSPLENKLLKHNDQINFQIAQKEKALLCLDASLHENKTKKEKYLDGLLSSKFSSKERDFINTKLQELEGEEKQIKTTMMKQELSLNQTKENRINISEIKKLFIGYRSNHPFADEQTHRIHIATLIDRIQCSKDSLQIQFSQLPWKEVFPMSP